MLLPFLWLKFRINLVMLLSVLRRSTASFSPMVAIRVEATIKRHEYINRRRLLLERLRDDVGSQNVRRPLVIVVASAKQQFYAPDVPYPYRQSSYFRYLTGLVQPKTVLTIVDRFDEAPLSILYVTKRTAREELWEGHTLDSAVLSEISGVDDVRDIKILHEDLEKLGPVVGSCDTDQFTKDNYVFETLSSYGKILPLREYVDALRWIKSSNEQNIMRKTCEIGAKAMNGMISRCRGVTNENEVVGRLELEMRRRGASYPAYPPVVAGGVRANTIHYLDANQALNENDTVLVDAGCEYEGYVSDISRVFPVSGEFTGPQKDLYDALLHVHKVLLRTVETVRPLTLNQLYVVMVNELAKNLRELNIFSSVLSSDQLILEIDRLCPHHVSHYLGMDVHDTATVPRNIPVVPGVIFTVEPGIYIRKDNEVVRKEFRGLGMRIEDDILVKEDGCEVLTHQCLREIIDIERLMNPHVAS